MQFRVQDYWASLPRGEILVLHLVCTLFDVLAIWLLIMWLVTGHSQWILFSTPLFLFKVVARLWTKWKISPVFHFLLILCQPFLLIENYEWYRRDPMVKLMEILAPSCLPLWWLRWCKGGVETLEFSVGFRLGPRVRYFQTKLKAMFTNLLIYCIPLDCVTS